MTDDITLRWSSGERSFPPGSTVSIGRDPSCDVVLENPRVSRQHAELRHSADGWTYVDASSTRGSFVGTTRITQQQLDRSMVVRLGGETDGEQLELVVPERTRFAATPPPATDLGGGGQVPPPPPPPVAAPTPPPPPSAPPTAPPAAPPAASPIAPPPGGGERPGGVLREEPLAATVVTGQSINVQVAGKSYTFQPGKEIVIGRDPSSDVQVDNPVVSRRHAGIRSTGAGWELADYGSSSGTFVDGQRITTTPLRGSMAVFLGPEDVGERMVTVTAGQSPPSNRKRASSGGGGGKWVLAGIGIALVAAIIAVVALVTRGGGSDGPDLANLKEATVLITAGDRQGSGAVISDDGLILTNAHVVAPDALGRGVLTQSIAANLPESPPTVDISVLRNGTVEPAYVGKVVAADGYLDLAVVRITSTAGGSLVQPGDDLDLQTVKIGDPTKMESGDDLFVVGYPGIAGTNDATVSDGTLGSFLSDPRLNDNHAWINTDANISGGNSGGLAADNSGRLIGTPTAVQTEDRTNSQIARIRPVHLAAPLIEAARNNTAYVSPYVKAKGDANFDNAAFIEVGDHPGFSQGCERAVRDNTVGEAGSDAVAIRFDYTGLPADAHQDVLAVVQQDGDVLGAVTTADQFPFTWGNGSGCATVTVPLDDSLSFDDAVIALYVGGNYETGASFSFTAN